MPRGDTSPCQPCHHSPSSRAKPTLSALNSGRCTNISMPLCPPISSSVGESLAWRKNRGVPQPTTPWSSFPASLSATGAPDVLGHGNPSSPELGELKIRKGWQLGARLSCHGELQSTTQLLSPGEGTLWGLTRHKGEVDGAGKRLSLCLQPPDGLEVPAGRRWCHGREGLVCSEPPQGKVKQWHPHPQGPWGWWHPVLHHSEASLYRARPAGAELSTHWMETHFMSWAPRA